MAWFLFIDESGHHRFANIVETDALPTEAGGPRKDYAYLFERFFFWKTMQESSRVLWYSMNWRSRKATC